jgi:riboflavin biosynthesis pyrimidine reductase
MRRIYPAAGAGGPADGALDRMEDLAAAYAYPEAEGPWVRANMVASADGAVTVKGLSGGLSSDGDRRIFGILRGLADVILVGAGTARTEGYGPARPRESWQKLREGRPPSPPIAVVTRLLDLDLSGALFSGAPAHAPTIVLTTETAPADRRARAAENAEVVIAGAERVDPAAVVSALAGRGFSKILTEGGPRLLGQLTTAAMVDELCLSISPVLVGGDASRVVTGALTPEPWHLRLVHVLEQDGSLFCRYIRENPG